MNLYVCLNLLPETLTILAQTLPLLFWNMSGRWRGFNPWKFSTEEDPCSTPDNPSRWASSVILEKIEHFDHFETLLLHSWPSINNQYEHIRKLWKILIILKYSWSNPDNPCNVDKWNIFNCMMVDNSGILILNFFNNFIILHAPKFCHLVHWFQNCFCFCSTPKMGVFGYFGGTENGTSGAGIKILRPLFNTNTPPKTAI